MTAIAQVEPLTTARALRGPFDYKLPESLREDVVIGSVLLVPFARRRVLGVVTGLSSESDVPPEKLAEPIRALASGVPPRLVELGLWVAEQYCSTPARGLSLVTPPGTGTGAAARASGAKMVFVASLTSAGANAIVDAEARLTPSQRTALTKLSEFDSGVPTAHARELIGMDISGLRRLEARGLVEIARQEQRRTPRHQAIGALPDRPNPTPAQRAALDDIVGALDRGHENLLLHGVTGSGKTEVYLGAAEASLARGRGVIVMVPEIALTPQVVTRFGARFGDRVAVLHSQLTAGERHDEWLRLSRGEADICVGPRSAIFAPIANPGLIILDEEHDASYKQDGDPRYDAREVALQRAALDDAVLLAGSATPRAESWLACRRITLPERVDGQALPPVELLDMTEVRGNALHPQASAALAEIAARREKAIVLLNRRGWSNFVSCQDCGRAWICPNCDVTLVLHMQREIISCHHCGHKERVPDICPDCGSTSVARHGAGTERLEYDLRQSLGGLTEVFRLDADTAAGEGVSGVLGRFESAQSGVLIGTQMVAKGHDFPDVTLGLVLDADATLRFPDFRAEERTFALVAQLAGRSGRGKRGGRVLVQTNAPESRSLRYAARHDAEGFVTDELTRREAFGYPPFSHIIKLQTLSADLAEAMAAADALAAAIDIADGRLLGPTPLFKRKGLERFQLEIKAFDRALAVDEVRAAVDRVAAGVAGRGVKFSVDVDPQ
ncbi:MAG: primosomal protein N' [Solirubrobacterales bacterium]